MDKNSSEKDHSKYTPLICERDDEDINANMPHPESLFASHPIKSANCLSKIFFSWASKVTSVSVH
jgi:hypothetical protein